MASKDIYIYNGLCIFQELKMGEEFMHDRKVDFEGYIDKAENNSSSNVVQNKDGCCNKEEETETLSSAVKG